MYIDHFTTKFFAREFGHALGMDNDYKGTTCTSRTDKSGKSCLGANRIMSYGDMETWSQCSIDDMADYFAGLAANRKNCKGSKGPSRNDVIK